MRLSVSKRDFYHADFSCADSTSAKRVLRENPVSIMALDFYLVGRENGTHLLMWAREHNVLPMHVVVTESDRAKRSELASTLSRLGYRSANETTYIKMN